MYSLAVKKSARKELDSLPHQIFFKIDAAILLLRKDPFPHPQSRKLKGDDIRRLRVGDYRVVYSVDVSQKVITVFRVRHRREVYR